jgi:hypothetical protein
MTDVQDPNAASAASPYAKEAVNDRFTHVGAFVRQTFDERLKEHKGQLFHTKTKGLSTAYLDSFEDPAFKQSVNCVCCQQFIRNFGGLCFITDTGEVVSAIWDATNVSDEYKVAFGALEKEVSSRRPVGRFWGPLEPWGRSEVNGWKHFSLPMMEEFSHAAPSGRNGASRTAATTLNLALNDFSLEDCNRAMHVLSSGALNNQKKFVPMMQFLIDLHQDIVKYGNRSELVVKAAGYCPDGWSTPRDSMIGNLIGWVREGKNGTWITRNWNDRVRPEVFKRPTEAPAAGQIRSAEKLIEELGLKESLKRRLATFDEIKPFALWVKPEAVPEEPAADGGVFGHLTPKGKAEATKQEIELPPVGVSLNEFISDILPKAKSIEVSLLRHQKFRFSGFMTAVDPEAPPILKWDSETDRNPFSGWAIRGTDDAGIHPYHRGLPNQQWHEISGFFAPCSDWSDYGRSINQGGAMIVTVPGQIPYTDLGQALFPDCVTSKLHAVRATIESYSNNTPCPNPDEVSGLGLVLGVNSVLRVKTESGSVTYHIAYVNR